MFGKKTPAPPAKAQASAQAQAAPTRPAGWAVQILTEDCVLNGYIQSVEMPLVGHLNIPTQAAVVVSAVQLRPLDGGGPTTAAEVIVPKTAILALLPRDEAGLRSAAMQMPQRAERAVVYLGPYVVRAAFQLAGDMPLRNFLGAAGGDLVALTQAEILCPRLGANFPPLQAPIAILNKKHMQLFYPA